MHEMSVAIGIMKVLKAKLTEEGPCELTAAKLAVGELSGIDRESLKFALDTLLDEEGHKDGELCLEQVPASFKCNGCGWGGQLKDYALVCPECKGGDLDIVSGQDVYLERIEVK